MSKDIYIFSGLGADKRAFKRLDFSDHSITFITWPTPHKKETIEDYVTRLLGQVKTKQPTLIGLSFGGLLAIEAAKQIETEKVILIASAKTKKEIPFYYRLPKQLGLQAFIPTTLMKHSNFMTNWLFGAKSQDDKDTLKEILKDTDDQFLAWAIDRVSHWENAAVIKNLIHIHGTSDKIFPFRFVKCDKEIKNGGHFMTFNKADELTKILKEILS